MLFPGRALCPAVFPCSSLGSLLPGTQLVLTVWYRCQPSMERTSLGSLCCCTETQGTLERKNIHSSNYSGIAVLSHQQGEKKAGTTLLMSQENPLCLQCQMLLRQLLRVWIWSLAIPDRFGFGKGKKKEKKDSSDLCPQTYWDHGLLQILQPPDPYYSQLVLGLLSPTWHWKESVLGSLKLGP